MTDRFAKRGVKVSRLAAALAAARDRREVVRLMGAHNALSARIVERSGADAVWGSGFEIAATACMPDANLLTMTEVLARCSEIANAVDVPILMDCDTGFGNVNNVRRLVNLCEMNGIDGICIEDKLFPKLNSFVEERQELAPAADFAAKIVAAVEERKSLLVVARLESLIAGAGMDDALHRAAIYERAGADALVVHSKQKTPVEIEEFTRRYRGELPIVVIPTTYPAVTVTRLRQMGISGVVYANQALRGAVSAMTVVAETILRAGSTAPVENDLSPMAEIYGLQRMSEMLTLQSELEQRGRALAAQADPDALDASA